MTTDMLLWGVVLLPALAALTWIDIRTLRLPDALTLSTLGCLRSAPSALCLRRGERARGLAVGNRLLQRGNFRRCSLEKTLDP